MRNIPPLVGLLFLFRGIGAIILTLFFLFSVWTLWRQDSILNASIEKIHALLILRGRWAGVMKAGCYVIIFVPLALYVRFGMVTPEPLLRSFNIVIGSILGFISLITGIFARKTIKQVRALLLVLPLVSAAVLFTTFTVYPNNVDTVLSLFGVVNMLVPILALVLGIIWKGN